MFYCESCREERKWPSSFVRSMNECEICNKPALCHDVPASALDKPTTDLEQALGYKPRQYSSPILSKLVNEIKADQFNLYDPVTGHRNPRPSEVRLAAKSLIRSLNKLMQGEFSPSGTGSKTYHEDNVERKLLYLSKHHHLLTRRLKPSGKQLYPKDNAV